MTLEQLFEQFRSDVDDVRTPFLWSDADLERYFNWALEKLAEDTRYYLDRETYSGLTITEGQPKIAATSENFLGRIIFIQRAVLGSTGRQLAVKSMNQADEAVSCDDDYGHRHSFSSTAWETDTGVPRLIITDYYDDGSLRIGPVPNADDTVSLWAHRLPLSEISFTANKEATLEELVRLRSHNHELALLQGMKSRAFLKDDPETHDTAMADDALLRFAAELVEIKQEVERRRRPAGVVRYGGL